MPPIHPSSATLSLATAADSGGAERMKRFFTYLAVVIVALAGGVFAFKEPLMVFVMDKITADMFVAEASPAYAPGVVTGSTFPAILASYQRRQLTGIDEFIGDKGMIFIAVRSVDW